MNNFIADISALGGDAYAKQFFYLLAGIFVILIFWWFYKVNTLTNIFLKAAAELLGIINKPDGFLKPFYTKQEIKGDYKDREVAVGVIYTGFKNEFLPLPHIQMRLKEAVGYNVNRLPNYAIIEKNLLIYKIKLSVLWGVFDKNYPHIFSKKHLAIVLEKLLSTADDVERGRTIKEIFR